MIRIAVFTALVLVCVVPAYLVLGPLAGAAGVIPACCLCFAANALLDGRRT